MTPEGKPSKAERSEDKAMSDMETPAQEASPTGRSADVGHKRAAGGGRRPPQPPGPGNRKEDWIAHQLRRVYDGAAEEEIPKSMLDLLRALDESDGEAKG